MEHTREMRWLPGENPEGSGHAAHTLRDFPGTRCRVCCVDKRHCVTAGAQPEWEGTPIPQAQLT